MDCYVLLMVCSGEHCRMIRSGKFGNKEYFQELCDTVAGGDDFYLVGNDFASYLEAQVCVDPLSSYPHYSHIHHLAEFSVNKWVFSQM